MTKTPEQIRTIIEGWIKITNAKLEDITKDEQAKQSQLEWIYRINGMMAVYMLKNRSDRITFDIPIHFATEHRKATSNLPDVEFLNFIINIVEPLAMSDIAVRFQQNQKEIQSINLQAYVDTESLEREKFYKTWDKIRVFRDIIIKKFQAKFGVKGLTDVSTTGSSSGSIYG